MDNKVQSRKDIEKVMGAPIIGDVPKTKSKKKVVVSDQDRDATAESFSTLTKFQSKWFKLNRDDVELPTGRLLVSAHMKLQQSVEEGKKGKGKCINSD